MKALPQILYTMDFVSVVLFLILNYVRPQEWMSFLLVLRPVTVVTAMAIASMFMRKQGIALRDFFRTPHDWAMFAYFVWIQYFVTESLNEGTTVVPYFVFYILIRQALNSRERIMKFLQWWAGMVFLIAALAVASEYGFDPTGTHELTHGFFRGRLVLNNSMFSNPNALGHSVIPLIPMVFFLIMWKRLLPLKFLGALIIAVGLWCVYLTESKGAFISGLAAATGALMFGRPKFVQALVLAAAVTGGWSAVKSLPRMEQMRSTRAEGGIVGRIDTLTFGLATMEQNPRGVGFRNYNVAYEKVVGLEKALSPHCSYNAIGAELGYKGLFMYIGLMYCCLRTLVMARPTNTEDERIRRMLFVMVATYAVSGWLIDFSYRVTFWVIVATVAAFHLHLHNESKPKTDDEQPEPATVDEDRMLPATGGFLDPVPSMATSAAPLSSSPLTSSMTSLAPSPSLWTGSVPEAVDRPKPLITWNRIGVIDLVLAYLLTEEAIRFWKWLITDF
jgi:hypothetical protein